MVKKKIILKHYEEDSNSLNKQWGCLESIEESIRCADKKYKGVLKKVADEIDKEIKCSLSRINEVVKAWEGLKNKFYKGKYGEENIMIYPYEVIGVNHCVFCLCVCLDDMHAGIHNRTFNLEYETHDFELEEITKEEFIEGMTQHGLDVFNYRINRQKEKK